jgi:alpha-beta hydrolase superfamily lysophospholipase
MSVSTRALRIEVDQGALDADLALPTSNRGIVVFAHGSGSSRRSPRNLYVASRLHQRGFGTLLFDLLTVPEQRIDDRTRELRFDVALLAGRLEAATRALGGDGSLPSWRGYFGASTGAAAALVAAATSPAMVHAIVSRGGRPDLAGEALAAVRAPTLLIVGGDDTVVLGLNEQALRRLACPKELQVVSGATHLFEEPGALDEVCDHAIAWFDRHCSAPAVLDPDDRPSRSRR